MRPWRMLRRSGHLARLSGGWWAKGREQLGAEAEEEEEEDCFAEVNNHEMNKTHWGQPAGSLTA